MNPFASPEHGSLSTFQMSSGDYGQTKVRASGFISLPKKMPRPGGRVGRQKEAQRAAGETWEQCWNSTGSTAAQDNTQMTHIHS